MSELPQIQRVAAYNVCIDDASRLLMCRLSDITERPGAWTLPGGGIDFGEHPEAGAIRELLRGDGIRRQDRRAARGRLAAASRSRGADGIEADYHAVRIVYRTEITGGMLRDETDESTDRGRVVHTRGARDDAPRRARTRRCGARVRGAAMIRFPIRYNSFWRWVLPILLLPRGLAYIQVDGNDVKVRMGWAFRADFLRSDVMEVVNRRPVVSIGAHGWKGRWLVNGANSPIAVIRLSRPTQGRVAGFPVQVREILVSVDDRDALRQALVR